jgi:hypothetical protein
MALQEIGFIEVQCSTCIVRSFVKRHLAV